MKLGFIDGLRKTYNKVKAAALGDTDYGAYDEDYEDDEDGDMKVVTSKKDRYETAGRSARPPLGPINPAKEKGEAAAKPRGETKMAGGVVQMPGTAPRGSNIVINRPESIDDCDEICMEVREGAAVALNLEGVEHNAAQRIVDFCAGVVAALDGEICEAADKVFIVAPRNYTITGQSREILRKAGIVLPYEGRR